MLSRGNAMTGKQKWQVQMWLPSLLKVSPQMAKTQVGLVQVLRYGHLLRFEKVRTKVQESWPWVGLALEGQLLFQLLNKCHCISDLLILLPCSNHCRILIGKVVHMQSLFFSWNNLAEAPKMGVGRMHPGHRAQLSGCSHFQCSAQPNRDFQGIFIFITEQDRIRAVLKLLTVFSFWGHFRKKKCSFSEGFLPLLAKKNNCAFV